MDQRKITEDIQKKYDDWGEKLINNKFVNNIKTEVHLEDFKIAEDGVPEYNLCVNHKITPITSLRWIDLSFIVLPTGVKFEG
jgi:hypothetical protein